MQRYLDENNITTCTLISTEYINSKTPLEFKCNLCGKTFKKTFDNLRYAKFKTCASCSHKENGFQNKYTEKDVDEILAKDGYIRMEPYINTHTPFKCRCSRGHDFTMHFSAYLVDHGKCWYCAIEDRSGENAYQWKGGYENVIDAFRYAAEEWKKDIL